MALARDVRVDNAIIRGNVRVHGRFGITGAGIARLVGGSKRVTTPLINENTLILLTNQNIGGTAGLLHIVSKDLNIGFTIQSVNPFDASDVGWFLVDFIP